MMTEDRTLYIIMANKPVSADFFANVLKYQ